MTEDLGSALPLWAAAPFAGLLLSIAALPLAARRFWHRHYPKVAAFWAALFAIPFLVAWRGLALHELLHAALADYLPFVILLTGLYCVAGGIVVRGRLAGTPAGNTALLAVGTLAASWVGTTGAAMILVRPLLRANAWRERREHLVVFFIFLVANVGGALTPLGDPPLFIGFLRGVPFFWTLRLADEMAIAAGLLLATFYVIDRAAWRRERRAAAPGASPRHHGRLRLAGRRNLIFLAAILGAVLLSGTWHPGEADLFGVKLPVEGLARDAVIVAAAALAIALTPKGLYEENGFTWEPVREVAILFAGIFATIVPLLAILRAGDRGALGPLMSAAREPWRLLWASGLLSSVLDNAPTYLAFLNTELGMFFGGASGRDVVARLASEQPVRLAAIAVGSVFMGANTYIGNAPNFMVKSLAEHAGVRMPSFLGYVLRWSVPILVPVFLVVTWLFFRG